LWRHARMMPEERTAMNVFNNMLEVTRSVVKPREREAVGRCWKWSADNGH
jgi:hypothetical protein